MVGMVKHVPGGCYSPIQFPDGFRVLVIQPALRRDDPIICSTLDVRLSSKPPYEALSYQWGDKSTLGSAPAIVLNGKLFRIRRNLLEAISHLRLSSEPRTLWIDAICINQDDDNERNQQVTQMGGIYSQASQVIAWLALGDEQTSSAIQIIANAPEWKPPQTDGWIADEVTLNELERVKSFFCSKSYWERLWIIQELVLAEDVLVHCGDDQLPWNSLRRFFEHVYQHSRYGTEGDFKLRPLRIKCSEIRKTIPTRLCREWSDKQQEKKARKRRPKEQRNMYDICSRYAESLCEDPRDKVYGLLSFAAGCCRVAIPVDYSLCMYQVCGLVLEHYCHSHLYEEGEVKTELARIPESNFELSEVPIMRVCQLFHTLVGVSSVDRPPRASRLANKEEILASDPDIRRSDAEKVDTARLVIAQSDSTLPIVSESTDGTETPAFSVPINTTSQQVSRLDLPLKFTRLKSWFGRSRNNKAPGAPVFGTPKQISETKGGRQIRVWSKFRGRITHISPIIADSTSHPLDKPWAEVPYFPQAGDDFIAAEIQRIIARSQTRSIFTRELDLVQEASCIYPQTIEVVNPGLKNEKLNPLPTSHPPILESSHTSAPETDVFPNLLDQLWRLAYKNNPKNFANYRIAIEQNGLISLVPPETKIGDLVCLFSDCDIIAILRPAGAEDPNSDSHTPISIVGRGASFLSHPAHTPLRDGHENNWPPLPEVKENRIPLDLDIDTLQLLTLASTTPDDYPDVRW